MHKTTFPADSLNSAKKGDTISVIVPTKNSVSTINRCLDSVFSQTRMPDEIIIVDGASRDGTTDVLKNYSVKLVTEPGLGFGHSRNIGVQNASCKYIFFLDSDCYADKQWIENAMKTFQRSKVMAITGPTLLWDNEPAVSRFLAFVRNRVRISTDARFVEIAPTMNLALRRDLFKEIGLFDESLVRGEDTDWTFRASRLHNILWDPQVRIWFKGSPNLWVASRKCVNHFIGIGQIFLKHGFRKVFMSSFLPLRGLLIILVLIASLFGLWPLALVSMLTLFCDLIYKMTRMSLRYRDRCVFYYLIFFSWWAIASLAVVWGMIKGCLRLIKMKNKIML